MNTSIANLSVSLQPSKVLLITLGIFHLLASVSILLITIPILFKVILILLILLLGFVTIKQFVLLNDNCSVVKLNCADKGNTRLTLKNGSVVNANIVSAQWLFEYFVVLIFKNHSKKYKAVIAKDALSQEQFYTLRLYLRSLNTLR